MTSSAVYYPPELGLTRTDRYPIGFAVLPYVTRIKQWVKTNTDPDMREALASLPFVDICNELGIKLESNPMSDFAASFSKDVATKPLTPEITPPPAKTSGLDLASALSPTITGTSKGSDELDEFFNQPPPTIEKKNVTFKNLGSKLESQKWGDIEEEETIVEKPLEKKRGESQRAGNAQKEIYQPKVSTPKEKENEATKEKGKGKGKEGKEGKDNNKNKEKKKRVMTSKGFEMKAYMTEPKSAHDHGKNSLIYLKSLLYESMDHIESGQGSIVDQKFLEHLPEVTAFLEMRLLMEEATTGK